VWFFFFWYGIRDGTRTHLNATVQWTVAATSANTGSNTYFALWGKMQIESYIVHQRKSHPNRDGFFLLVWHSDIGLEEGGDGNTVVEKCPVDTFLA